MSSSPHSLTSSQGHGFVLEGHATLEAAIHVCAKFAALAVTTGPLVPSDSSVDALVGAAVGVFGVAMNASAQSSTVDVLCPVWMRSWAPAVCAMCHALYRVLRSLAKAGKKIGTEKGTGAAAAAHKEGGGEGGGGGDGGMGGEDTVLLGPEFPSFVGEYDATFDSGKSLGLGFASADDFVPPRGWQGLRVSSVVENKQAAKGGKVALADWVIAVDGVDVSDVTMQVLVRKVKAASGAPVVLRFRREATGRRGNAGVGGGKGAKDAAASQNDGQSAAGETGINGNGSGEGGRGGDRGGGGAGGG
jgi:hypothetical protein